MPTPLPAPRKRPTSAPTTNPYHSPVRERLTQGVRAYMRSLASKGGATKAQAPRPYFNAQTGQAAAQARWRAVRAEEERTHSKRVLKQGDGQSKPKKP